MKPLSSVAIVGANGQFGQEFAQRLASEGLTVLGCDRDATTSLAALTDYVCCDISSPSSEAIELLQRADGVLLCLPEEPTLAAIQKLAPHLPAESILADIASVKTRVARVVAQQQIACEYLSLHPMFGPDAGFTGRNVCVVPLLPAVDLADPRPAGEKHQQGLRPSAEPRPPGAEPSDELAGFGPKGRAWVALFRKWGARVSVLSVEEHDRTTALVQVAAHAAVLAFARTCQQSDVPLDLLLHLGTPVSSALLALTGRIIARDPELYRHIQTANPFAADARRSLQDGLRSFLAAAESAEFNQQCDQRSDGQQNGTLQSYAREDPAREDPAREDPAREGEPFALLWEDLRGALGQHLPVLGRTARRIVEVALDPND